MIRPADAVDDLLGRPLTTRDDAASFLVGFPADEGVPDGPKVVSDHS